MAPLSSLQDASGRSLWDLTFSRVHTISSGLNPSMLEDTLTPRSRGPSPRMSMDDGAAAAAGAPPPAPVAGSVGQAPAMNGAPAAVASEAASQADGGAADFGEGQQTPQPGPRSDSTEGIGGEGVQSHPISPSHLDETPQADTSAEGAAGAQDAAAAAAGEAAQTGAAGQAGTLHNAADGEDEYSKEVQAEQSSSTCKPS